MFILWRKPIHSGCGAGIGRDDMVMAVRITAKRAPIRFCKWTYHHVLNDTLVNSNRGYY